jgi:protein-S-isoprenylcysteine O-methyltransferase Ste14
MIRKKIKQMLLVLILAIIYSFGGAYLEMAELIVQPAYFSLYGSIFGFIIGWISLWE